MLQALHFLAAGDPHFSHSFGFLGSTSLTSRTKWGHILNPSDMFRITFMTSGLSVLALKWMRVDNIVNPGWPFVSQTSNGVLLNLFFLLRSAPYFNNNIIALTLISVVVSPSSPLVIIFLSIIHSKLYVNVCKILQTAGKFYSWTGLFVYLPLRVRVLEILFGGNPFVHLNHFLVKRINSLQINLLHCFNKK